MTALYHELESLGIEVEMLTNDFRSAGTAKDLGVKSCTTVETIFDIDFVAERGDTLILDSPEDDMGKLEVYHEMFAHLYRVANSCDEASRYGEQMIEGHALVDQSYISSAKSQKIERDILFYADSDSSRDLSKASEFFKSFELELLLGEYFYADYESDLEPIFDVLYESEEYAQIISSSSCVLTSLPQTAHEAHSAGAYTVFIEISDLEQCSRDEISSRGIPMVKIGDKDRLAEILSAKRETDIYSYPEAKNIAKMILLHKSAQNG